MTKNYKETMPVQAFFATAQRRPGAAAMIQPLGDGQLRTYTWAEVENEARRMATYLAGLGLPARSNVALMSKNCAEWIIADLAILMAGYVSVPLYPTLTAASVKQILDHCSAQALFVGKLDVWDDAKDGVPEGIPKIAFSLAPENAKDAFVGWAEIVASNEPMSDCFVPVGDDLATIIYTSGTTGMPKGVMQTFGNLAVIGGKMDSTYPLSVGDRVISYLPLSHVAERAAIEMSMLYIGLEVSFAESLEKFGDDLRRTRPHLFFAVPRIWSKFYQKASEAMPPAKLRKLLRIPILGKIVRKKILTAMGLDQCRIALSGAAALSPELIDWFKSLGLEVLEVYGMTENMGWSHTTREGDQCVGRVGTPNEGVECRLGDGGEIQVKSLGNMAGYYLEPELTAEAFTADGWLRTGDVGHIDERGRLKITGRVKEIFKTEKGKYIAPAPIENRLITLPGVEQACVVGPELSQPIALLSLAAEQSDHICGAGKDDFHKSLEEHLVKVNAQLEAHERLQCLVVVSEPWAIENGLLTPTLKLKRGELEKFYQSRMIEWAVARGVVWG
ncbi:MAG: AMP-binding protein [Gammaproteobacteria bacterium]|jgi:long-chain acyl-CoA synthetase|nr:AMP-binding protein [Gammaproteobacteria bacterium]MBQ0774398.1 AMP-binding protein [Gammaproteobacteria bacterium]